MVGGDRAAGGGGGRYPVGARARTAGGALPAAPSCSGCCPPPDTASGAPGPGCLPPFLPFFPPPSPPGLPLPEPRKVLGVGRRG